MQDAIQGEYAVELCLRSAAPSVARGRQGDVRDRVETLESSGVVAETTVNYWSSRVCLPGTAAGPADRCPRVVGEILDAARDSDVRIAPYFRARESTREGDGSAGDEGAGGETETVLFLPVICLLVRADGDLVGIYPVTEDGEGYTVTDGLDRLEAGEDPANLG